ncbi:hypothetical protein LMG23994_01629 [Cupriavidus pinatubonensis]|uniref:Uncharacterized protein n=1 Tax=Cupriavidus pinatubonensis TaxID=248026 RepID=A0ABM8WQL2_9BURK|nr:hypothetical protein LMG23994_01629 [Cupriavidus pinatubonensis]
MGIEPHGCFHGPIQWGAWLTRDCYEGNSPDALGATAHIAAMRAYVARFGEEVPEISESCKV